MIERKCAKCKEWDTIGSLTCPHCGYPLAPELIIKKSFEERKKKAEEKPPSSLELFLSSIKNSESLIVRIIYRVLRTVWVIYMAILSFFLWLVAISPG